MALVKGQNSYVTLSEADSYFDDRVDVSAWVEAGEELKEQSLVTATHLLDELHWEGQVRADSQALSFPRIGSFRDPSRGVRVQFSSYTFTDGNNEAEVGLARDIRLLRRATYELAYHLVNNNGLLDRTGSVTNIKVGSIALTEVVDAAAFPRTIRKIVERMLKNQGSKYWRGW